MSPMRAAFLAAAIAAACSAGGCSWRLETFEEADGSVVTKFVPEAYFAYLTVERDRSLVGWFIAVRFRPGTDVAEAIQLSPPGVETDRIGDQAPDLRGTIEAVGRSVGDDGAEILTLTVAVGGAAPQSRVASIGKATKSGYVYGASRPGSATADEVREALIVLAENEQVRGLPAMHARFKEYAFQGNEDPQVRVAALTALRLNRVEMNDADLANLRRCLGAGNNNWVRAEAAECLGAFRHPRGADALVLLMKTERDAMVRAAAARALGKFSSTAGEPEDYLARLRRDAASGDPAVRRKAAADLAAAGEDRRPAVVNVLKEKIGLNDDGPFGLKVEQTLSLIEISGDTEVGDSPERRYNGDYWSARLLVKASETDQAFARGGTVDPRRTAERSGWQKFGDFWYRTFRLIRKEERPED